MARIRTIKPEFWSSEQVVECSPIARLLFIGMWNFCDDGGNHPASVKTLKMEVFPGDDISISAVQGMVSELIQNELLIEYVSENKRFWHVTGWHHQKIDRPNRKYPDFNPSGQIPPKTGGFDDRSSNDRRLFGEQSPEEGKGKEGKGRNPPTPLAGGGDVSPLAGLDPYDPANVDEPGDPPQPPPFDPLTLPLPHCVPLAAWVDWIEYRRSRRLTCREATLGRQLRYLAEAHGRGHDPAVMIDLAIRNGWQGLFEPKSSPKPFTVPTVARQARRVYQ